MYEIDVKDCCRNITDVDTLLPCAGQTDETTALLMQVKNIDDHAERAANPTNLQDPNLAKR